MSLAALGCPLRAAGLAPAPHLSPTPTSKHHGLGFLELRAQMQSGLVARLAKDKRISPEEAAALQADLKSIEGKLNLKGRPSLAEFKALRRALFSNMNKIRAALRQGK